MASLEAPSTQRQRSCSGSRSRSRSCAPSAACTVSPVEPLSSIAATTTTILAIAEPHTSGNITNNSLPPGTDLRTWRRCFIPTIIQYIARQLNPWAIASRQMIPIMQTIWDTFFSEIPQTITATCPIYRLVCGSAYHHT